MKCIKMPEADTYKGWCWKYSLACLLEVDPKTIPSFSSRNNYLKQTRHWLKRNFNKGLIFIPANQFLENQQPTLNPPIGPMGYSIMVVDTTDERSSHAVIAKDGKLFWDSSENNHNEFTYVLGYFVVYDLEQKSH